MKNNHPSKPCQWAGCADQAIPTERFCPAHRRAMLARMQQDGYLQELPDPTPRRRKSAREDRTETRYGTDR